MKIATRIILAVHLLFVFFGEVGAAEYRGTIAEDEAIFELNWSGDKVNGTFYYLQSPDAVRRIEGRNPANGVIELDEYVGQSLVARSRLTKSMTDGEIEWSGLRTDQDGRQSIRFTRTRDRPSAAVTVSPLSSPVSSSLTTAEAAAALGHPGQLEAHLYGKLYLGWHVSGAVKIDGNLPALVTQVRKIGSPVWAAMRFEGDQVELQYETIAGERHRLPGTNPSEGVISLTSDNGTAWHMKKVSHGDAIIWLGRSEADPSETLLIYRPGSGVADPLDRLAPEAFLYVSHSGDEFFHRARFDFLYDDTIPGTVRKMDIVDGAVAAIEILADDGNVFTIHFPQARRLVRVPVAEGFPVSLSLRDGAPAHLGVSLVPLSWRRCAGNRVEFEMVSTDLAGLVYDDNLIARFPAGRLETLRRVIVDPDYAIIHPEVQAQWHLAEDTIVWTVGDEGAAMLELESLDLDATRPNPPLAIPRGTTPPNPWHSVGIPIDFPTNQLRMQNRNDSYGYSIVLP